MPRRNKFHSPTLTIDITEEAWANAVKSKSSACVIADSIRQQHPKYGYVSVDMATIRFTDSQRGERYIYLTPPSAQHLLLSFDQGWELRTADTITIKRALQIVPVTTNRARRDSEMAYREARLTELEAKEADGELNRGDKAALTRMRHNPVVDRPTSVGKREVSTDRTHTRNVGTVRGGQPIPKGKADNLLDGRNRHFGAKLANPGEVFQQAVEAEVAKRLAEPT